MKYMVAYKIVISKEIDNSSIGVFFQSLIPESGIVEVMQNINSMITDTPFSEISEDSIEYFRKIIRNKYKVDYSDSSYFFNITILSITKIN